MIHAWDEVLTDAKREIQEQDRFGAEGSSLGWSRNYAESIIIKDAECNGLRAEIEKKQRSCDVIVKEYFAQLARVDDVEGMAKVIKDSWLGNSGILAPTSIARAISAWLKEGK